MKTHFNKTTPESCLIYIKEHSARRRFAPPCALCASQETEKTLRPTAKSPTPPRSLPNSQLMATRSARRCSVSLVVIHDKLPTLRRDKELAPAPRYARRLAIWWESAFPPFPPIQGLRMRLRRRPCGPLTRHSNPHARLKSEKLNMSCPVCSVALTLLVLAFKNHWLFQLGMNYATY